MIRPLRSTTSAAPPQTALNSDQAAMADDPTILIITGVSGSGKTTIATALAQRLHWSFKEGADLHPASDISKMHAGHPLDDRDQWPLLERIADWIDGWAGRPVRRDCLFDAQAQLSRLPHQRATRGACRPFARRQGADWGAPGRTQRAY